MARKAGFSVPAFSRIFKQANGYVVPRLPAQHPRRARQDAAQDTTLSAEQIAQACGFQSQHHLIRSFKKVTKSTPGNYRKDVQTRATRPSTGQD